MEPFDSIEKLITEHGSATIQRTHITLLKELMSQKDTKIKELEVLLEKSHSQRDDYKQQVDRFTDEQPPDRCPFCRRLTGELTDLKPHRYLKEAGVKIGYYKCSNCGKEYDKNIET